MKPKSTKTESSGFTLIEIMVAISIFSIVMVIAIGSVLAIVSANRKAAALNSVITNLNFAIEGMVRDLRTGYNYNCDAIAQGAHDCTSQGASKIGFYSAQYGESVGYGLGDSSDATCPNGIYKVIDSSDYYCLTGPDIKINQLKFYVSGTTPAGLLDYNQPRIVIVINGNFIGYGSLGNFNLQSTVSQRRLDI